MFAENLANRLIGLLVTVGVLAAVYLFAIKPIIDTTNNAFEQFGGIGEQVQSTLESAGIDDVDTISEDLSPDSFQRLEQCVQRAGASDNKIQACVERFTG